MSMDRFHSLARRNSTVTLDGSLSLPTIRQLAACHIDLPASDEESQTPCHCPAHCENL